MSDQIKLKVSGMTCNHCVMHVTKALNGVSGVDSVIEVSLDRGEALVEGSADTEELIAAVKKAGYEARLAGG
jgi:copper chaperone